VDLIEESNGLDVNHWYYRHKLYYIRRAIAKYKPEGKDLSDVGAGSAIFTRSLLSTFPSLNAIAVDINYSDFQLKERASERLRFSKNFVKGEIILLNDVLEHIEAPKSFVDSLISQVDPGTVFIVTVPAFQVLWSGHDVFLKHFRRYDKSLLLSNFSNSDVSVLEMHYLYWSVFPAALIMRKVFKNKNSSQMYSRKRMDKIFDKVMILERFSRLTFLPGISLFAVLIKNETSF
jgi:2-polyprenyl-3-methyl-5-hydroxy-6-metoxy-1,4-benzoquinol methylase